VQNFDGVILKYLSSSTSGAGMSGKVEGEEGQRKGPQNGVLPVVYVCHLQMAKKLALSGSQPG
jgi:hypothetical protein